MNKNLKKSKNDSYYQKIYNEYNTHTRNNKNNGMDISDTPQYKYQYDIKLDEYFRIRNESDNKADFKAEEKSKKMDSYYLYGKNKTLVFQGVSFLLVIVIIISGILLYGSSTTYEIYDFFADIKRDVNMPDAIPAAAYDKDVINELNARLYGFGGTATAVSNENAVRIFKKYNMKYIDQNKDNMPNGCEVVSLAMVLSRYLPLITSQEIAEKYLPRASLPEYSDGVLLAEDPTDYYIGDPAGRGYGIFAPGLTKAAEATLDAYKLNLQAINISGCTDDELFKYISEGYPVIVWITMRLAPVTWGAGESKWHLPNQNWKLYRWPSPMHCAVLVDYTDTKVTLYDPTAGIVDYDKKLFLQRWNELGPYEDRTRQALVIK